MRRPIPRQQAIDDMTGFKVDHAKLKKQWDGALTVDPDKRNPQDTIRARTEQPAITNPRPEPADVFMADNIYWENGTPMIAEDGSALLTEGILGGTGL